MSFSSGNLFNYKYFLNSLYNVIDHIFLYFKIQDSLLATISETEKQAALAARVATWKQRIEQNLDEQVGQIFSFFLSCTRT